MKTIEAMTTSGFPSRQQETSPTPSSLDNSILPVTISYRELQRKIGHVHTFANLSHYGRLLCLGNLHPLRPTLPRKPGVFLALDRETYEPCTRKTLPVIAQCGKNDWQYVGHYRMSAAPPFSVAEFNMLKAEVHVSFDCFDYFL